MLSLWPCANAFQLCNYLCITLYLQNVIYKLYTHYKMSWAEVVIKPLGYYKSSNCLPKTWRWGLCNVLSLEVYIYTYTQKTTPAQKTHKNNAVNPRYFRNGETIWFPLLRNNVRTFTTTCVYVKHCPPKSHTSFPGGDFPPAITCPEF